MFLKFTMNYKFNSVVATSKQWIDPIFSFVCSFLMLVHQFGIGTLKDVERLKRNTRPTRPTPRLIRFLRLLITVPLYAWFHNWIVLRWIILPMQFLLLSKSWQYRLYYIFLFSRAKNWAADVYHQVSKFVVALGLLRSLDVC